MDTARGTSPRSARRQLGGMIRHLRTRASLTLEDLGAAVQRSAATISRLENGQVKPRVIEVKALLDHLDSVEPGISDAERDTLMLLTAEGRRDAWYNAYSDVLAGDMVSESARRYMEYETDATNIQTYEPVLVPGLLQVAEYSEAVAAQRYPNQTAAQRRRFVEYRVARKDVLTRPLRPLQLHALIGDAVLRRPVGGAAVMDKQLSVLADEVRDGLPNVTIQVVPAHVVTQATIGGPFVVMTFAASPDDDLVFIESRLGGTYLQSDDELADYQRQFTDLAAQAYDRESTLTVIEEARKELG
jgi:transcriptional regulator with XRE-family HTH domain